MGEFEQLVLLAVLRLENCAYGMEVRGEIERRTHRDVSHGAVYTTLGRLRRKGFVSRELGEPTAERGGRAKMYFQVEPTGRAPLRSTLDSLSVM